MSDDPVGIRIVWWAVGGGLIGTTIGLTLYAASVFGSEFAWAGITLVSAVFSFPAGLWVFDFVTNPGYRGPDLGLAVLVVGPAVNGAILGASVGSLLWLLVRLGSLTRAEPPHAERHAADSDRGADA